MLEAEEIKEITVKDPGSEKIELMVTIPLKEYRKLVHKVEKYKTLNAVQNEMKNLVKDADNNWRYYQREKENAEALRKNLDEAKAQIAELLGVKELEKVKEMQEE